MSNFQTFGQSIKFQQNSTQEQTDDNITQPFTPENFKFFSIKKIRQDNLKQEIRTKTQEQQSNDKQQNQRGFNGKSDQEIINLFENKKEIQSEAQLFQDLMEEYKSIIDEYFQSVFSIDYSLNSLSLVFGKDLQTFGSKITNQTRQTTEFISVSEYNFIKQQISRHHKVQKLLQIIGSQLFYQLNSQYLYITNHALKNTDKIDYLITSQNLFNDPKIKYINFRATNKKVQTQKVKKAFLTFIQKFMSLIVETYQQNFQNRDLMLKQNDINSVNLKKFALYSSKSDYFRSQDENSAQITFMPKKKIHF